VGGAGGDGRSGGIFLTRRAAARFAEESCEQSGCATMFVTEPLELDFVDEQSREKAANAISTPIAFARSILKKITRALAGERRNRLALERDLFGGRYTLCSKSDDDFPVIHDDRQS
jgi:hypothetical protein